MPPKKAAAAATASSEVYVVVSSTGVDSVHASSSSATLRVEAAKKEGLSAVKVELHSLVGGSTTVAEEKKVASRAKKPKVEDDEDDKDVAAPPKKTKSIAEQKAANADRPAKGQVDDKNLPDNIKALLASTGTAFAGSTVVVTGIPPIMGRKNTEKLVEAYGAHLGKSLSKKTGYVVVGNEAGPKKLDQIEELGLKTFDEDELIEFLTKASSGGAKHDIQDDEDDEDDEESEEEKPKPKAKKQKK